MVHYYLQHNLMRIDPIVRHSLNSKNPFFWSEVKPTNDEQLMRQQALSFGLSPFGYSVPTIDVGPYQGLFALTISDVVLFSVFWVTANHQRCLYLDFDQS